VCVTVLRERERSQEQPSPGRHHLYILGLQIIPTLIPL